MSGIAQELDSIFSEPMASVLDRERNTLDRIVAAAEGQVVLFGIGSLGRRALLCLRRLNIEPLACADNNERLWGTRVDGVEILSPSVAAERFGGRAVFIVTIWTAQHRFADTRRTLEGLGAAMVYPGSAIYWRFPETFLPYFAQDLPHKLYLQADQIREAAELWHDEHSRRLYMAQVRWRALGDCDGFPNHEPETYFPSEFFDLNPDEVFVDCGAFDGDTIRAFLATYQNGFRSIVAIEPDATSFSRLETYVSALPRAVRDRITLIRSASGGSDGLLSFDETGGVNSRVTDGGQSLVRSTTLSALFESQSVSFVKMDIEGGEFDALQGARIIIARDRPVLAVCVYHRQDDLWRVPLLIREFNHDYRMHLRMYESDGWQTVAYAVPPDRVTARAKP